MRLIDSILDHPKKYICFLLISLGFVLPGLGQLQVNDDLISSYLGTENSIYKSYQAMRQNFSEQATILIGLPSKQSVFTKKYLMKMDALKTSLLTIPGVVRITALSAIDIVQKKKNEINYKPIMDYEKIPTDIQSDPSVGALVSPDQKNSFITLSLDIKNQVHRNQIIAGIDQKLNGTKHYIVGLPIIQSEIQKLIMNTLSFIAPLAIMLILLLLWFFTGSIFLASLPIIIVLLAIGFTLGIAGYLGMPLTGLSMGIPQVLLAIGVCDGLHLISSNMQTPNALKQNLRANFIPTLITSLTTSLSFLSFSCSSILAVAQFGFLCSVGSLLAWFFTYVIVGSLIKLFPGTYSAKLNQSTKMAEKFLILVSTYKRSIVFVVAVLTVGGLALTSQLNLGLNIGNSFSEELKIAKSLEYFKNKFGIGAIRYYYVDCGTGDCATTSDHLIKLNQFVHKIKNIPGVAAVHSHLDAIAQTGKGLFGNDFQWAKDQLDEISVVAAIQGQSDTPFLSQTGAITKVITFLKEPKLSWGRDFDTKVQRASQVLAENQKLKIVSMASILGDIEAEMLPQIGISVLVTILGIAFLFLIWFRSLKIMLIALLPNIITLALLSYVFYYFSINVSVNTMIVWCVCMGVAVDDTIHFIYHYFKVRKQGIEPKEAIKTVYILIGRALVCTTVILSIAFATAMFTAYRPGWESGLILSLAVIIALVVDLVFLPAFLMLRKI